MSNNEKVRYALVDAWHSRSTVRIITCNPLRRYKGKVDKVYGDMVICFRSSDAVAYLLISEVNEVI